MPRIGNDLVFPKFYETITILPSQVLTLFSTPITIIPGAAGHWWVPLWAWFEKSAGTGYTIGAATKLGLYYGTQIYLSAFTFPGFMDQAAAITRFSRGPGTNATELIGQAMLDTSGAPAPGSSLVVTNSVANLTGGTCSLKVTVVAMKVPVVPPF